jgi:hypothetical protein
MVHRWVWGKAVIGMLILSLVLPIHVWAGATSFGTARGTQGVEITFNAGKTWVPLGGRSLPLMQDIVIRSTIGNALIELADGSRLHVLPSDTVQLREAEGTIEVVLVRGRMTFQLPPQTRVAILTPVARLKPVSQEALAGEVFINAESVVGVKLTKGAMQVQELMDPGHVMLASLDPVFIPKRPASQGLLFVSDAAEAPSPNAKGVFTPKGESVGYLQSDGRFVIQPNFTADLTGPVPQRLIRLAMATIPEDSQADTMPLFDVNGKYLGYLNGSDFYPQTRLAQAFEGGAGGGGFTAGGGSFTTEGIIALGSIFGVGGTIIGCGLAGCFTSEEKGPPLPPVPPATPIQPIR